MQPRSDFIGGRRIDTPLTLDAGKAGKTCGDNPNAEMRFPAVPSSGVSGMACAFVFDHKLNWRERSFEFLPQAFLNGM